MTRVLQTERKETLSGSTRSAVVFLHGYGANAADLLGLADPLGEHLPEYIIHRAKCARNMQWDSNGVSNGFLYLGLTNPVKRNQCAACKLPLRI